MSTQLRIKTLLTNVTNDYDLRGNELVRLSKQYITELAEVYYGHRPIGAEDVSFPCAMIEPTDCPEKLTGTGKYDITCAFDVFIYFLDNDREALIKRSTDTLACYKKLLSNNALNDLVSGGVTPSSKYKINPGFWYDSEIRSPKISPVFIWPKNEQSLYCRVGFFTLITVDRQIK